MDKIYIQQQKQHPSKKRDRIERQAPVKSISSRCVARRNFSQTSSAVYSRFRTTSLTKGSFSVRQGETRDSNGKQRRTRRRGESHDYGASRVDKICASFTYRKDEKRKTAKTMACLLLRLD